VRGLLAVFRREFTLYFITPIAWIVLGSFLLITGIIFYGELLRFVDYSRRTAGMDETGVDVNLQLLTPFFFTLAFVGLFMIPLLTMRLLAEERRQGTLELLLTYPLTDFQVVFGKYLAAMALFVLMLAGNFWTLGAVFRFGSPDPGPVISGYLGVFLYGAAFIALGLMLSSLTENQIVAAVLSFGLFLALWFLQWASTVTAGAMSEVLRHASIVEHFQAMSQGIVDTKDVIYFLTVIFFGLFVALQAVAAQRWRGN
jgi:ABC-2 type transport system permease protein